MRIISRAEWGARPSTRPLTQVGWSKRVGVAVHYTFGNKTDTPLQLQKYAQDTLGYADGHYNLLVDHLGRAYEGRGWTVSAAHSEGENVQWIGIAFIGRDADVTPQAEATIAALCTDADALAGRGLQRAGHQELPGAQTSCPGPRLMALVRRLRSEGDDVSTEEVNAKLHAIVALGGTSMGGPVGDDVRVSPPGDQGGFGNSLVDQLAELRAGVEALKLGGVDIAALAEALAPLLPTAEQVADVIAARLVQ